MPTLQRGILISFEGIDGSGKTALSQALFKNLQELQYTALLTKEPGGSPLGKIIRMLLQEKKVSIEPKAEFLLFAADRAQHFEQIIIPALQKNTLVISDRLDYSSLVYQGYAKGVNKQMINVINSWAMNNVQSDLIVYVKIDAKTAAERRIKRGNMSSFDRESKNFFDALIYGYETELFSQPNVLCVDGTEPLSQLTKTVTNKVTQWIAQNKLLV